MTSASKKAHQYPSPRLRRLEATKVVIIAIAPWAKLIIFVARKIRTSDNASSGKDQALRQPVQGDVYEQAHLCTSKTKIMPA